MKKSIKANSSLVISAVLGWLIVALSLMASANEGTFEIKSSDFKGLFNQVRVGQPEMVPWPGSFWPYSTSGTSAKVENGQIVDASSTRGHSPLETFDKISGFTGASSANEWEKKNHTCDHIRDREEKASCEGWWGHCNGWAAAAIKEDEPKRGFQVSGASLDTSDVKGILAEVWLTNDSLFAGNTDKSTKTADGLKDGWIDRPSSDKYQSFWDVSPRSMFLILANYVGLNKMGVVIDRFTGDQVWNHPVVGYRMLPIDRSKIKVETRGSEKVWAVPMAVKLYWGHDDVSPGVIAKGFNVDNDTNDTRLTEQNLPTTTNGETAYEVRLIEFTLFFDSEVTVSADGKKILNAGRFVGDGIWKMQENPRSYSDGELDEGHPDFFWLPLNSILDSAGSYGNPYMVQRVVQMISKANKLTNGGSGGGGGGGEGGGTGNGLVTYNVTFGSGSFDSLRDINPTSVKRKIYRLMARGGMRTSIPTESVEVRGGVVSLTMTFPEGVDKAALLALFNDAGMTVTNIAEPRG
jgi:hypothetical protein